MNNQDRQHLSSQLYSDLIIDAFVGDIEIDGYKGIKQLAADSLKAESQDADARAHRFELITAVRSGKHVELSMTAQTFEQTAKPNRRGLRLNEDKLSSRAPSWKGQPYLTDHQTWSSDALMGSIQSSKAIASDGGVSFEQKLNAVKPPAVIGILDGTFRKFSIGWYAVGPVLCSVHGCDVMKLDSCDCMPLEEVLFEGKKRIVEFVFSDYTGKETSSVPFPAVQNTSVNDVRSALAAELGIPSRRPTTRNKENVMQFHRLAVALGLTALSEAADEDRAIAAVLALQARANTAESSLTGTNARLTLAESAVRTLTASQLGVQIDSILQQDGFAAGRLRRERDKDGTLAAGPVEGWLRKLGLDAGIEVMRAQLAQMPVIVPLGHRQAAGAVEPERTQMGDNGDDGLSADNPYLRNAAELTGQKVEDLVAFAKGNVKGAV